MLGEDPLIWNRSWDSQNKIKWRFFFFCCLKGKQKIAGNAGRIQQVTGRTKVKKKKNTQAFATFWPRAKEIIKKIIVDNIKCEDWNFSTHLHNNDTKLDFEIWDLRWRWSWRRTQTLCLEKIIRRKKTKPGD